LPLKFGNSQYSGADVRGQWTAMGRPRVWVRKFRGLETLKGFHLKAVGWPRSGQPTVTQATSVDRPNPNGVLSGASREKRDRTPLGFDWSFSDSVTGGWPLRGQPPAVRFNPFGVCELTGIPRRSLRLPHRDLDPMLFLWAIVELDGYCFAKLEDC